MVDDVNNNVPGSELPKVSFNYADSYATINITCVSNDLDSAINGLMFVMDDLKLRDKLTPKP